MTNITLSIDNEIYKKMRKFSEIKWSEFVRKTIKQRVEELEEVDQKIFADEKLLAESWMSKEDDEAFAYLQ